MDEDAAGAVSDPHDRRHILVRRVLEEPQIDRFAFPRAEMAERVRHLGVADPALSLAFGVEHGSGREGSRRHLVWRRWCSRTRLSTMRYSQRRNSGISLGVRRLTSA